MSLLTSPVRPLWRSLPALALLALAAPTLATSASPARAAAPAGPDPTVVVFDLYYGNKDFPKTEEYARRVQKEMTDIGGMDLIAREDAERLIRAEFPAEAAKQLDQNVENIQKLVKEAENLFFQGQLAEAQEKLRQANQLLEALMREQSLVEDVKREYISTQMLLALLYLRSEERAKAESVMEDVVRQVGRDASITTDNYHPEVVALYQEVYERLSTKRIGKITVRTNPPGAEVYINGLKQARLTPATYEDLYPGEILLQVKKGDKASRIRRLRIESETVQDIAVDLDFEAALAFGPGRHGLTFNNQLERKQNLAKFAAKLGEVVDADYVAVVGLGDHENETYLEGYLVSVKDEKIVREASPASKPLPTSATVVKKGRVQQLATYLVRGDLPDTVYKPWYTNPVGWSLVGGGLVVAGLGVIPYMSYVDDRELAECDPTTKACELDEAGRTQAADDAESSRTIAFIAWGVGAAAIIGGVLVFILDKKEDLDAPVVDLPGRTTTSIVPIITPDGHVGLGASFSF